MFNKFTLLLSFSIIAMSHFAILQYTKIKQEKIVVANKPTVVRIALYERIVIVLDLLQKYSLSNLALVTNTKE